jgi:hypothetical protein
MRRCHVDTASFGPRAIELAVDCLGADRVVLGTDCPIFDTAAMMQSVYAARITPEQRALVVAGNARRLFRLPADEALAQDQGDAVTAPARPMRRDRNQQPDGSTGGGNA